MMVHQTMLSGHTILQLMVCHSNINYIITAHKLLGMPCDANGNYIDPSAPPPDHGQADHPNDWTPYGSQLEFKTAEFLFLRNQMSAGDVNILLDLWAASLLAHGDEPPFTSHKNLYNTIDTTPLGDVPWESFSVRYNGARPPSAVPSWMDSEFDVWFCNPHTLVQNMLSNPDF
jgi:hypothetical protein